MGHFEKFSGWNVKFGILHKKIAGTVHFWDTQDASTSWVTDIVQLPNIVHILFPSTPAISYSYLHKCLKLFLTSSNICSDNKLRKNKNVLSQQFILRKKNPQNSYFITLASEASNVKVPISRGKSVNFSYVMGTI